MTIPGWSHPDLPALLGGIEAGGTKWVCAVGDGEDGGLLAETRIPAGDPGATLDQAARFFIQQTGDHGRLAALGIGSFGPLDLDPSSPTCGFITTTLKPGWAGTDLAGYFMRKFEIPVNLDTDVNTALIGESAWGAGRDCQDLLYLTVGTGIGGGALVNGQVVHGLQHPEMGHTRVPHDLVRDPFPGICAYHGDCLEGLACGPALQARWGHPPASLPRDHPAWDLQAHYLALGLANFILTLSPQRIILGGGVMEQRQLFPLVRAGVRESLAGYLLAAEFRERIDQYIVPAELGEQAGVMGALRLAWQALQD